MNRFKKIVAMLFVICFIFSFTACSGKQIEFKSVESFEYHFYPEDYGNEYSPEPITFSLKGKTDYQLQIDATCESGAMEIVIIYESEDTKTYTVNTDAPCHKLLTIPANTTNEVTITISIKPGTKGEVIGDLLAPAK